MSAVEDAITGERTAKSPAIPIINRILDLLSSVRLGVFVLCVLIVLAMAGMLIIQQNVVGFDAYYAGLTPAEKIVFGKLGLFDIYHSWYFNFLLVFLSLNLVLSSIDHFPAAWSYISKPKTFATRAWLAEQRETKTVTVPAADETEAAEMVKRAFEANGLNAQINDFTSSEYAVNADGTKDFNKLNNVTSTIVFGEKGKINRLGAYVVHVALLTLFMGHFVANQTGFDADVRMIPGESTDLLEKIEFDLDKKERFGVQLPFTMTCTDIQQKLIDQGGNIGTANTLDWRTEMRIDDPQYGTSVAEISLNKPFTYRGYRFFQAQTIPVGNARTIDLTLTPQDGSKPLDISINRGGTATLDDGTIIEYAQFLPDFTFNADGKPDTRSGDYNNPVAILNVTRPDKPAERVFAFQADLGSDMPVGAPKAGFKWRLSSFEKVPLAHVLSVKYDPYNAAFIAWYIGGFGLIGALCFVFFISHRRVWAMIGENENGEYEVLLAGDTNRNHSAFEEKFEKIAESLEGGGSAEPLPSA
jgi:cytochrome c biogenesis protein